MSDIKNIYYECSDCNFCCKTKKEMIKHIKEVKCTENSNKLEKKNKNDEKRILRDKMNKEYVVIANKKDYEKDNYFKNLNYVEILNNEIPELNIKVEKEAFEAFENFLNPNYVNPRIFYFLIDKIVLTYCFYMYDRDFNPREVSFYEKSAILEIIKKRFNYYKECTEEELKSKEINKYNEAELKILKKFEEDAKRINFFNK